MAADLFPLWQNALEKRTVGHDTVRVRVDLEIKSFPPTAGMNGIR